MSARDDDHEPGDEDGNELIKIEGPLLRRPRDNLMYWGASLVRMNARADLHSFHPPPTLEHQQLLHDAYPDLLDHATEDPSFGALIGWSVEWARSGFPRIDLGHKLCASLMATSMSVDAIADLAIPWPAFAILVPHDLLQTSNALGEVASITCAHAL